MSKSNFKVLKNFRDSQNDYSLHQEGEEVELADDRGADLVKLGYVSKIHGNTKAKEKEPADKEPAKKGGKTKELKESPGTINTNLTEGPGTITTDSVEGLQK
jgi:hypothetical protein